MGEKGSKSTSTAGESAAEIVEKLAPIGGITSKRMFGGYGIFHEGKMFGIINTKGERFFKVNETTETRYSDAGSHRHSKMPYFQVPPAVWEDFDALLVWANESISISK